MISNSSIYFIELKKMLSQSMLQKFTSKIEKLVTNQQSQRSDSPIYQQNSENSQERSSQIMNKINSDRNKSKAFNNSDQQSEKNVRSSSQAKNGNYNSSQDGAINLDDNQQAPKSQKIDVKQLSRLIALEKQKAKSGGVGPTPKGPPSQTIKKSIAPPMSSKTPIAQPPQPSKPTVQMPKVSVMNNLVKLSIKLNCKQLLKQIKYQAGILSMAPIRLLLYVCIQKILFHIYVANGYDKMIEKQKDAVFLEKQISAAIVSLLGYLKNGEKAAERTMISRILRAVFNRFGIPQFYSEKWLTDCIKKNRKALEKLKVEVEPIEKPPTNNNITSNILKAIPQSDVKIAYDFPNLDLEDQEDSDQKVQDPQSFHTEQTLFFFKKQFNKQKLFQKKPIKAPPQPQPQPQSSFNYDQIIQDGDNYEQQQFSIQISKLNVPSNTQVFTNPLNFQENKIQPRSSRSSKAKENKNDDEMQLVSRKRYRSGVPEAAYEQSKYGYNVEPMESDQSKRAFVLQIVEEYIFNNIEQIADKIAQKWKIDPEEVRQLIKSSNQFKMMPSKSIKPQIVQTGRKTEKQQSDTDIIKQIQAKSQQLQKSGVNHKELVKQIFKLLQSKSLSHQKKQQIMQKWIAIRKQQKKQPQR